MNQKRVHVVSLVNVASGMLYQGASAYSTAHAIEQVQAQLALAARELKLPKPRLPGIIDDLSTVRVFGEDYLVVMNEHLV